jgi:hypothetical protein
MGKGTMTTITTLYCTVLYRTSDSSLEMSRSYSLGVLSERQGRLRKMTSDGYGYGEGGEWKVREE